MQLGWFLGRLLGTILKAGLPLLKNVLERLAKKVLIPLGLIASASTTAIDATIQKKSFGSETTLIISNEEIDDLMKIVKCLKDAYLLITSLIQTIENEAKKHKGRFGGMLLGTSDARLSRNMLGGKEAIAPTTAKITIKGGEGAIR